MDDLAVIDGVSGNLRRFPGPPNPRGRKPRPLPVRGDWNPVHDTCMHGVTTLLPGEKTTDVESLVALLVNHTCMHTCVFRTRSSRACSDRSRSSMGSVSTADASGVASR